jgi:hypothetical protein
VFAEGPTIPNYKYVAHYELLKRVLDLCGFFGMTEATENGHWIWNLEFQESL